MSQIHEVLVATDFGGSADDALAYARDLAARVGARLHVLHVVDDLHTKALTTGAFHEYQHEVNRLVALAEQAAVTELNGLLSEHDRKALRAKTAVLVSSHPADAIADYAGRERIDLVVVGAHGRGTLDRLLLGSVADHLVRIAPCPVLVVRARKSADNPAAIAD